MIRGDPQVDFPPDQFRTVKRVALIDEHTGARSHQGKPLKVDEELLQKIADNQNRIYKHQRCPVWLGRGHTKDGEEVDEKDQPEIVGYATNLRVEPFEATDRKALYADLHFKKEYESDIRDYPGRSIELYPSTAEVPYVAILRKVPERPLPVIKFSANKSPEDLCRLTFNLTSKTPPRTLLDDPQLPLIFSRERPQMPMTEDDKDVQNAQQDETQSQKAMAADIADLKKQVAMLLNVLEQAMGAEDDEQQDGDEGDLMAPADKSKGADADQDDKEPEKMAADDREDAEPAKKMSVEEEYSSEDDEDEGKEPVKMNASAPCYSNVSTPSTKKDKAKMSRETEASKFEKEAALKFAKIEAENEKLRVECNRLKAEKVVQELKTKEKIKFGKESDEKSQIELLAHLDEEAFNAHVNVIKTFFARETPNSTAVFDKLKFARTEDGEVVETMEDVQKRVEKKIGKTYAEAVKTAK